MTTEEEIRELHNQQIRLYRGLKYPGTNCLAYAKEIRTFVSQNKIRTLLDYGAGQGEQYNEKNQFHKLIGLPRQDIDLYDIGVRTHDKLPANIYDCVLSVDVFQYIPESLFEYEFNRIYSRAKTVFAVVNLCPSDSAVPSLVTRPTSWWDEVFCSFPQMSRVIYYGSTIKENGVRIYHGNTRIG